MNRFNLFNLFNALTVLCASAQIQESWVARYNGGFPGGTNQAVALALDNAGNIIVSGSSRTNNNFDYVTIKYVPNGTPIWTARHASPDNSHLRAMVADEQGNILVTGTSATVKYNSGGTQQWTAPYAGRALAVDSSNNVYVTGFSTNDFATAKLNSSGSNVWVRTYDNIGGTDESQAVAVDCAGSLYVSGQSTYAIFRGGSYRNFATVKYDSNGNEVWASHAGDGAINAIEVKAVLPEGAGNVYVTGNPIGAAHYTYATLKYDSDGNLQWLYYLDTSATSRVKGLAKDVAGNLYLTGGAIMRLSRA